MLPLLLLAWRFLLKKLGKFDLPFLIFVFLVLFLLFQESHDLFYLVSIDRLLEISTHEVDRISCGKRVQLRIWNLYFFLIPCFENSLNKVAA